MKNKKKSSFEVWEEEAEKAMKNKRPPKHIREQLEREHKPIKLKLKNGITQKEFDKLHHNAKHSYKKDKDGLYWFRYEPKTVESSSLYLNFFRPDQ